MPSANAEHPPSEKGSSKRGFAAGLTTLNWKKDKKRILMMAGGAVLAVVIVMLIPRDDADANGGGQAAGNPVQALTGMARTMRPDLEVASVDGTKQTITLKDQAGALWTFKLDPQTKTLVPLLAAPPEEAANQQPPPPEQPAATLAEWMPIYPGTSPEIVSSALTREGDKQVIATFKSDDKPSAIVQFYQTKLQESGFKIEAASSGEPGGTIQSHDAAKKRMLILNVDARETGTTSRLVTVEKK